MIRIYCDFDGTITDRDTIVFLTERFGAGPEFRRKIVDRISNGEISVFEAVRRELETVHADWDTAVAALREAVHMDPYFEAFVAWCRSQGWEPAVVSSGMEPVVRLFLGHLKLPTAAHRVTPSPDGWRYEMVPEADKERILASLPAGDFVVYVGDGTSDVSVIPYVDLLFAKRGRYLDRWCKRHGVAAQSFESFREVREHLQSRLRDAVGGPVCKNGPETGVRCTEG